MYTCLAYPVETAAEEKLVPQKGEGLEMKGIRWSIWISARLYGPAILASLLSHYWDLWQLDASLTRERSQLKISDKLQGEEVTISEDEIEAFCRVVCHEGESYKKGYKTGMQFPMDFAIKLGWKSIMKLIFPDSVDGDPLKLVHLSNGFSVLPGAPVLQPGDVVISTSRLESVTNSDTGKTVAVKVSSSFFYRGKFIDYAQTFSRVDSPTYSVPIKSAEALAVLQSKEWFEWDDEPNPLSVGTDLHFKVDSSYVYADQSSYPSVGVTATSYIVTPEQKLQATVAIVEYSEGEGVSLSWEKLYILEIVHTDPKGKTVHFGGLKGQATRQKQTEMTYTTIDAHGNVKTLPLFGDIDLPTSRYTFSSPTGLLYATQFAQIALVVTEKAVFEDMRSKGLVQPSCAFAGHSLGEYSALASIADILPISAFVDVVFYRGITMQRAVERDSQNRSSYGMVAVNPSRISKSYADAALREVVETIARRGNILSEVVNYNVEGQQYVVAGHLVGLQSLTNVLNFFKVQKIYLAKLTETMSIEQVKEHLCEIIDECVQKAKDLQEKTGFITLERGYATIPLPGIDVPFHSCYLWAGVMPFRTYLSKKVKLSHFNADLLVGRYIPNLTAVPYEVTKEYAERIHTQTSSPRLEKILKAWDEEHWGAYENRNKLGYIILIELFAYQFASPVRWIETQDVLFKDFQFHRLIELGPSPTLTGMATRTRKLKYESHDGASGTKRSVYCIAKQLKEIYYQRNDESGGESPSAPTPAASSAPAPRAAPAPVAAVPPPPPVSAGPASAVADEPLKAVDTLRIIIAQKLKKPVSEVPLTKDYQGTRRR
ncbi:hypothetical protein JCM5350_006044 [Sporobolomyces pararoseus]